MTMIIENRRKVFHIRLRALFMTLACGLIIGTIYSSNWYTFDLWGMKRKYWAFIVLGIYLTISFYFFYLNYYYVYFYLKDSKFIVRYYSLRPFVFNSRSFQMPVNELARAEIKSSFFGLKKRIVISRRTKKGMAKYPAISLSALPDEKLKQLKLLLKSVLAENK